MGDAPLNISTTERSPEDRLDSWKEIAAYLKRDVTTVQRWEKREGMPVHRHLHDRMGSVYASRAELDAWTRSRNSAATEIPEAAVPPLLPTNPEPDVAPAPEVDPIPTQTASPKRWRKSLLRLAVLAAVALGAVVLGIVLWLRHTEYFWKNPIAGARFSTLTDFDGVSEAAAISRDGNLVAFLSDRDGPLDVWVTQVGSGEFHNLTRGAFQGLSNPAVRTLAFSPDSSLVTFWLRRPNSSGGESTGTWAVPTLGGEPRPYLDGVAEFDWSRDGSQLAFHTSASGDPISISTDGRTSDAKLIFTAASGLHSHFPLWSRDSRFIYFVGGSPPDNLDIWRISSSGGTPERITFLNAQIMYPVLLDGRTLLYLATDPDGSGPWMYSLDVDRRIPHRLSSGPERYTSLATTADGHHLAVSVASTKKTLWRLSTAASETTQPVPLTLSTGTGSSPRHGAGYLLFVSTGGESIHKLENGTESQLWHSPGAHIVGAPAISFDGRLIAFNILQDGHSLLNLMQSDGTNTRVLADGLDLEGSPAWSPDGLSVTVAAKDHGTPHLIRIALDGRSRNTLVPGYSQDPAWSPDNRFLLYSGPDIGTTFNVNLLPTQQPSPQLANLTLTRGARHLAFLQKGKIVVFLRGDIQHKDLWQRDLQTGVERRLTTLPPNFNVNDFDLSPDGSEIILERAQERSEVMLLDLSEALTPQQ